MFSMSAKTIFKTIAVLATLVMDEGVSWGVEPTPAAESKVATDKQRQELIEIMKGVNFVPQLGADKPMCKNFYEEFKKQTNIELLQPIVKAESYDDPALKPYRDKCPKLDMRKTMTFSHRDIEAAGWPTDKADAESRASSILVGQRNFQFFSVDIDNNPKNGKEYVLYYEGEADIKPTIPQYYPSNRVYATVDFNRCEVKAGTFSQLSSDKWTRTGIIRYQDKYAIYVLKATDNREYYYFTLFQFSEKLDGRIAPICSYHK